MTTTATRFNTPLNNQDGASREALDHSEGKITRAIENQTAKIPSDMYLLGALGSIGLALALQLGGEKEKSHFVGQWVAPFLLLGVYNKLVKVAGSDRVHTA